MHEERINDKPFYNLLSSFQENRIFLVPQHGSALDLQWGGKSQLLQIPAAFITSFFSQITIEKLIQTLCADKTGEGKGISGSQIDA